MPDFANPQDLNRYSYVLGNPVRFADPTGHFLNDDLKNWFGIDWQIFYGILKQLEKTLVVVFFD